MGLEYKKYIPVTYSKIRCKSIKYPSEKLIQQQVAKHVKQQTIVVHIFFFFFFYQRYFHNVPTTFPKQANNLTEVERDVVFKGKHEVINFKVIFSIVGR